MASQPLKDKSLLRDLVEKAIEAGGSEVEIEYKDGREGVFALRQGVGVRIASLDSNSEQARSLREELYRMAKRKKIICPGRDYVLPVRKFDSFGEDAFNIMIKKR